MKAKLIDSYRWSSVTLNGSEFVKTEVRHVDAEIADRHSAILEVQKSEAPQPVRVVEVPKVQPKPEPVMSEPVVEEAPVVEEGRKEFTPRKNKEK